MIVNRKKPNMSDDDRNQLALVQQYRELVLIYEALDEKIDNLITTNGGGTENMSEDDLQTVSSNGLMNELGSFE